MSLAAKTFLRDAEGKAVPIRPAYHRNALCFARERNFLKDFSRQRFRGRLAGIDAALRKLPGSGLVGAFANQDAPGAILQNGGDSGAKDHGGFQVSLR